MLYLIGLGLNDEKDISVKGLDVVKKCDVVYLENYTAVLNAKISDLEIFYGKKITLANRELVEKDVEKTILANAKTKNVAFLVVGDPLAATTHYDLMLRAKKAGIVVKVIRNASVMNAIAITGLQLYKFGKTTSIPFPAEGFEPETFYDILKENQSIGAHTLFLLDLKPSENKFMTVNDAIRNLLKIELKRGQRAFLDSTMCIGAARLGADNYRIVYGKAKELLKFDFGNPMHVLIVPGRMHFAEEDALEQFKQLN
jgi:diphthine synthase